MRLIFCARSVPPVIDEIRSGLFRVLPKNVSLCVDVAQIQFRQGLVHETELFQTRGQARKFDIFFEIDPDMIVFAALSRARSVTFVMARCSFVMVETHWTAYIRACKL